jgi:hypothetical protein
MAGGIYNSAAYLFYSILFQILCLHVVSELASMPICSASSFRLCKFSVHKIISVSCLLFVLFYCFTYVPKNA